jgi:hypothetical protein
MFVVIGSIAVVVLSVVIGLNVLAGLRASDEDDLVMMIIVIVLRLPVSNRTGLDTSVAGVVVLTRRRSATEKNTLVFSLVISSFKTPFAYVL